MLPLSTMLLIMMSLRMNWRLGSHPPTEIPSLPLPSASVAVSGSVEGREPCHPAPKVFRSNLLAPAPPPVGPSDTPEPMQLGLSRLFSAPHGKQLPVLWPGQTFCFFLPSGRPGLPVIQRVLVSQNLQPGNVLSPSASCLALPVWTITHRPCFHQLRCRCQFLGDSPGRQPGTPVQTHECQCSRRPPLMLLCSVTLRTVPV